MAADSWMLRDSHIQNEDLIASYAHYPTMFTIEIHHGGKMSNPPGRKYIGGSVSHVDLVDIDRFSILELDLMLDKIGYYSKTPMYYHFLHLGRTLDDGLEDLCSDQDVVNLLKFVEANKVIHVYIQHGIQNIKEFFSSPTKIKPKLSIQEIDEIGPYSIVPVGKNLFGGSSSRPSVIIEEINETEPAINANEALDDTDPLNEHGATNRESLDNDGDFEADVVINNAKQQDGESIEMLLEEIDKELDSDLGVVNKPSSDEGVGIEQGSGADAVNDQGNVADVNEQSIDLGVGNEQNSDVGTDIGSDGDNELDSDVGHSDELDSDVGGSDVGTDFLDDDDSEDLDYSEEHNNMEDYYDVDMKDFDENVDFEVKEDLGKDPENDVEVLQNDVLVSASESDENDQSLRKHLMHELTKGKEESVNFFIGQQFGTKEQAKDLVKLLSVQSRRKLKFQKNDSTRLRVICVGDMPSYEVDDSGVHIESQQEGGRKRKLQPIRKVNTSKGKGKAKLVNVGGRGKKTNPSEFQCPFALLISKVTNEDSWVVRTLVNEHRCVQSRKVKACTAEFLAKQMVDQIEENPKIPIRAVQEQFQKKYEVGVSKMKAYRAKCIARSVVEGDVVSQYASLWDYANELKEKNPETTVKIEVEANHNQKSTKRQFRRIYICYGALKKGFKAIGRDLLGLDGAFMKGPFPGQMLTAVGIDNNNGIYPLAFAIVEAECMSSWTWFLGCLGNDLDLCTSSNFTFISDRQKGLIQAVSNLFPCAEHRYFLRHIHENMKLTFRGKLYKDLLWKAATTTTVPEFEKVMDELKNQNKAAHSWLLKIDAKHWSRSHFSGRANTYVLLNNMCEVYNGKIIEGRDKPIVSALEYVRAYLMRRIVTVMNAQDKHEGLLTPNSTIMLEKVKKDAAHYHVQWNGSDHYQVSGKPNHYRVVDLLNKTCSCRKWELTGMPCCHAVAAIWFKATNGDTVGALESWVDPIHTMES